MTTLETSRLILRPLRWSDADAIVEGVGRLEIAQWLTVVPHPYTQTDAANFLETRTPFGVGGHYNFAITLPGEDTLAGIVALDPLQDGQKELGYWLTARLWQQGLTSEAAHRVVSWAFEQPDITSLYAGCHEGNAGSRRILEGLGFEIAGQKKVHAVALGKERVSLKFRLDKEHWSQDDKV